MGTTTGATAMKLSVGCGAGFSSFSCRGGSRSSRRGSRTGCFSVAGAGGSGACDGGTISVRNCCSIPVKSISGGAGAAGTGAGVGATGMGAVVLALYRFDVSQAWVFSVLFALIWPAREFVQNGADMMRGRSLAEWLPASSIIIASDIAGRVFG